MADDPASQWRFHHLLTWLQMSNLQASIYNAADLSSGVAISNILHSIEPSWFDQNWLSKIKENVGDNRILKVSNLKKVLERVIDFYEVRLDQRLAGFAIPDVTKIGESEDENELCRLLQLVLGCAVHCERQEEFIQAIQQMEEDVQRAIMAAIQALPGFQDVQAGASLAANADATAAAALGASPTGRGLGHANALDVQTLLAQLDSANEDKTLLTRQRDELQSQLTHVLDEVEHLQTENETLRNGGVMESLDKDGRGTQVVALKRQIQHLNDELLRSDAAKEDFRVRTEAMEQENERLRLRLDELQSAADQNRSLKDEMDILRERSARLSTAECTIDSMRKKVEEANDLKRQLRKLEEKNAQYIQQNVELEEELKKLGPWKSQLELQKKQIAEVQAKLDDERKRADKFEFQHKTLHDKFETLSQEKERLLGERDKLKDANEELRYAQLNHGNMCSDGSPSTNSVDTLDMIPPEIKEKLLRLQHENRRLREQLEELRGGGHHGDRVEVLQTVIDGLQDRIHQLEAENRKSNQRVLELENQLDESRTTSPSASADSSAAADAQLSANAFRIRIKSLERDLQQKEKSLEKFQVRLKEQEEKARAAVETLQRKDGEMQAMEERYKKYIEKAKMVLKTMDPKHGAGAGVSPELSALQAQLREKDRLIESLERESERHRVVRETEDQLMTTAFYNLGMQLQRQAMEQRLTSASGQAPALTSTSTSSAQGFLTRQRQTSVRGRPTSSINHGDTYN